MIYKFTVTGVPKPQPRPRAFARKMGEKYVARMYDDGSAEAWKQAVCAASDAVKPAAPIEGPVSVSLQFFMARPKTMKGPLTPQPHIKRPDVDNLAKAVLDSLKLFGWWRDDSQIWSLLVTKEYHAVGDHTGVVVTIY